MSVYVARRYLSSNLVAQQSQAAAMLPVKEKVRETVCPAERPAMISLVCNIVIFRRDVKSRGRPQALK